MRFDRTPRPRRSLVSLTPLIDVVFILLLFFLLASRFGTEGMLQLSAADSAAAETDAGPTRALLLRLHADGRLDLSGRELPLARLTAALAPYRARDPQLAVIIAPHEATVLEQLVAVMDAVRAAGIARVHLQ